MSKRRLTTLRFRKHDPSHNLLAAVQHFVKAHGGATIVVGGIDVMADPLDPESKFKIAVGCLGRRPVKPHKA